MQTLAVQIIKIVLKGCHIVRFGVLQKKEKGWKWPMRGRHPQGWALQAWRHLSCYGGFSRFKVRPFRTRPSPKL